VGVDHTPTCTRNREEKEIMTNENRDHAEKREDQAAQEGHPRDEVDRLVDETTSSPWFEALKILTDRSGLWVGTEDELMAEIEARAGRDASHSKDFHSYISESTETPPLHVVYAFRKARLEVLHYRTMEKELRENYDVPGWGRKAPIFLQQGLAGLRPSRDGALYSLSQYGNPLAASVVVFTYIDSKFKSRDRSWSGSTAELAQQLSCYPVRISDDMERHEQIWKVLRLERRTDRRRFSAMMKTCAYILKDVEVKVTWERITRRNPLTDEKYTYMRWTVEAPNWAPWRSPSS
jgi:hypothetical protein